MLPNQEIEKAIEQCKAGKFEDLSRAVVGIHYGTIVLALIDRNLMTEEIYNHLDENREAAIPALLPTPLPEILTTIQNEVCALVHHCEKRESQNFIVW